jgi:hypothetical protein
VGVPVYQAFRFELDPNNRTLSALSSHAGAARFAFKWGLRTINAHMAAYEVARVLALRQGASAVEAKRWAGEVTGPLPCTLPALRRQWNQDKHDVAPWWRSNSKEAYSSAHGTGARPKVVRLPGAGNGRRPCWPGRTGMWPNARSDALHKLTTWLAKTYEVVVVEDLTVRAMTASAKGSGHWRGKAGLNRAMLNAACCLSGSANGGKRCSLVQKVDFVLVGTLETCRRTTFVP